MKKLFFILIMAVSFLTAHSQVISDSLANDFRTFMAKNFSRYRTVNLYWETKMAHDYNFNLDGNEVEKDAQEESSYLKSLHHDSYLEAEVCVVIFTSGI